MGIAFFVKMVIVYIIYGGRRRKEVCMKVVEVYNSFKEKYPKYLIMIKVGNFYEVYGEDAYIMYNLFNYKIKEISGVSRVGFPLIAYNKVCTKLNSYKVNYLIIDKEISYKKRFNNNTYNKYITYDLSIEKRKDRICEKLKLVNEDVLRKIEDII